MRPEVTFKRRVYAALKQAIIEALESRDPDLAERLSREHTLGLAAYVEKHGGEIFA